MGNANIATPCRNGETNKEFGSRVNSIDENQEMPGEGKKTSITLQNGDLCQPCKNSSGEMKTGMEFAKTA